MDLRFSTRSANVARSVCLAIMLSFAGTVLASSAPAPKLDDLPLKDSVSQYGVTWTFEKPARVGQFVNGDYYVIGPVTVIKIDPAPRHGKEVADEDLDAREKKIPLEQRCRNGSMLNAPAQQEVAWDSGVINYYHAEHRATLPYGQETQVTVERFEHWWPEDE